MCKIEDRNCWQRPLKWCGFGMIIEVQLPLSSSLSPNLCLFSLAYNTMEDIYVILKSKKIKIIEHGIKDIFRQNNVKDKLKRMNDKYLNPLETTEDSSIIEKACIPSHIIQLMAGCAAHHSMKEVLVYLI